MSDILKIVHETVKGLYDADLVDPVTMREFDVLCIEPPEKIEPERIKELRISLKVSQAVFARIMNVKPITVKKWESGQNRPNGSSLRLLEMLQRKGLDVIV